MCQCALDECFGDLAPIETAAGLLPDSLPSARTPQKRAWFPVKERLGLLTPVDEMFGCLRRNNRSGSTRSQILEYSTNRSIAAAGTAPTSQMFADPGRQ